MEERVALLEIQVEELDEDLTITRIDLTELEGYVDFLFDEQVIQDERLLNLEQENDVIDDELESKFCLCHIIHSHLVKKSRLCLF